MLPKPREFSWLCPTEQQKCRRHRLLTAATPSSDLAQHRREGLDYKIESQERAGTAAILAIHGGRIEPGTAELARAIAGRDHTLYIFSGLQPQNAFRDLHITSTRFDEPTALALIKNAPTCVALHGYLNNLVENICLGGHNEPMKAAIFQQLRRHGGIDQDELNPCRRYYAVSRKNIVNRCRDGGVQIEISTALLKRLRSDRSRFRAFATAIREVVAPMTCDSILSAEPVRVK